MRKENRGGKRPGAGRPKGSVQTLSARHVQAMHTAARKYAKKSGREVHEVLLDLIYNEAAHDRDRLAAMKLWYQFTLPKLQEGGEADKNVWAGPAIFLPEQRPELELIEGG